MSSWLLFIWTFLILGITLGVMKTVWIDMMHMWRKPDAEDLTLGSIVCILIGGTGAFVWFLGLAVIYIPL